MFATKKDILNWCNDFLNLVKGHYYCPLTNEKLVMVRVGRYWKFEGKSESWLWKIEEVKANLPILDF